MRFKKVFAVLFCCFMLMPLAVFAACNQNEDNYSLDGFDFEDTDTWFDEEKTDLPSLEQCQKITVGMSFTDVLRTVGKPQRDMGYGAMWFQFDIDDGTVLNLWFDLDGEKEFDYVQNNPHSVYGTHFLYVSSISFAQDKPDWYYHKRYNLNELYPWINELNAEDVKEVRCEFAYIGVGPGHLKDISYSTDEADVENAFKILSSSAEAISPAEGAIDGGFYVKYDFINENGTYSVTISNGNLYIGNKCYKLVDGTYRLKSPYVECHSFITQSFAPYESYEIYAYGNESVKIGDYDGFGEFEFQKYEGVIDKTPSYRLKNDAVELLILSDKLFVIEEEDKTCAFQITGDKDFSFLFQ